MQDAVDAVAHLAARPRTARRGCRWRRPRTASPEEYVDELDDQRLPRHPLQVGDVVALVVDDLDVLLVFVRSA